MAGLSRVALETIVNNIPAGIVVIEKENGQVTYVNDRAIELYGVDPRGLEIPDHSTKRMKLLTLDGKVYPPEKLPASKALLYGEEAKSNLIIVRPDGSRVTVSACALPIRDENGNVIAAVGIFDDITESEKAERVLRESEQRYRTLVETSTDAIVVHKEGRFIFANAAALKLFGVESFEELTDRNIFDFIPADERKIVRNRMVSAQAGQKLVPQEKQVVRMDGKRIFVEGIGAPIYYNGNWAILAILRDTTERKQMQQKLEEYAKDLEKLVEERAKKILEDEQSYRELYESFDEAFIATDWGLNVIHWNKAAERITTVAAKDTLGKKIYEVLPEMTTVNIAPYLEILQSKKPARFMMNTISRQTGREAIFEISTYPSNVGIIIIVEDKTEEEQTKRLSAIGQTAGMVGHDIRNPLQAITSDLYLLREELKSMPQSESRNLMQESIESIDENVVYIDKIVSDLQDYTRPLKPNIEEVNLRDLINSTLIVANIPEKIDIQAFVKEKLVLRTDAAYLRRALTNLLSNALQAMPNGGKLTIEVAKKETGIAVNVSDTGVGIADEAKNKIFTPLFTTKSKGQGLGLAVVKRFVEALGGSITFESQAGKGTKFTISLPDHEER